MLTRREFGGSLMALAVAGLATGRATAAATGPDAARDVFLNRLTFGVTPQLRDEYDAMGKAAWLADQLSARDDDPELAKLLRDQTLWIEYEEGENEGESWPALSERRPLNRLFAPPEDLAQLLNWEAGISYTERERPAEEVRAAAMTRAVHAKGQLREMMTQFWHDHFNVNAYKDELTSALYPPFDAGLRQHALGNFRALLGHTAHSPVMLRYLNNDFSQASPANENYARELMELHTMGQDHYVNDEYRNWRDVPLGPDGLPIGYLDQDVYEVARAFTGWSVGDGRDIDDDQQLPYSGRVEFVESWHDPYQKRVLGVEMAPYSAPMADGKAVLDILARHPGTARFVSGKIIRRLGVEDPSEAYLADVAAVFSAGIDADDQIARVIEAAVLHPEFDATPPQKLRRPFEYLAAYYRMTGAPVQPHSLDIYWTLERAGWTQHQVRPPTGHSDRTADWADTRTIAGMIDIVLEAHGDWMGVTEEPFFRKPPDGVRDIGELAAHWAGRFGIAPGALDSTIYELGLEADQALPDDEEWFEWIQTVVVASASFTPDFLYR